MQKYLITLILALSALSPSAQQLKSYSGPYPFPGSTKEGSANYTYLISPDQSRIYEGEFRFDAPDFRISGTLHDNKQTGAWHLTTTRYNSKATVKAYFSDGLIDGPVSVELYKNNSSTPRTYSFTFTNGLLNGPFSISRASNDPDNRRDIQVLSGEYFYGKAKGSWNIQKKCKDNVTRKLSVDITPDADYVEIEYIDERTGDRTTEQIQVYKLTSDISIDDFGTVSDILERMIFRSSTGLSNGNIKHIMHASEDNNEDDNKVYQSVEQMPLYPGGDAALMTDVGRNIRYPSAAQENNIQGNVVVQFVVTKTGQIGEVKVVRGKDPDLDKEAMRVAKTLRTFTPGKMNGKAVNCWYTLPVTFKLQ